MIFYKLMSIRPQIRHNKPKQYQNINMVYKSSNLPYQIGAATNSGAMGRIHDIKEIIDTVSQFTILNNKKVMVIGPGRYGQDVIDLIKTNQGIKEIHIIDINENNFTNLNRFLDEELEDGYIKKIPPIYGYITSITELPSILSNHVDIVYSCRVLCDQYFSKTLMKKGIANITNALRPTGIIVSIQEDLSSFMKKQTLIKRINVELPLVNIYRKTS